MQLVLTRERDLRWREIASPTISDRDSALLRPIVVARTDREACVLCPTDRPAVNLKNLKQGAYTGLARRIGLNRFSAAQAVGQQCIAEVIDTGPGVVGLARGKRVVVTTKLSCGSCADCLSGQTAQCQVFADNDTFGSLEKPSQRGGLVCDLLRVPNAGKSVVPFPDTLDPIKMASAGSDLADAWCSVLPHLKKRKAARVLVLGGAARSTALYSAALAVTQDIVALDYIDHSAERVSLAAQLGANAVELPVTKVRGNYDVIVSGNTEAGVVRRMLGHLSPGGCFVQLQPQLLEAEKIPLNLLYANNLSLVTAKPHVLANLRTMLEFFVSNPLDLGVVNTHVGEFELAHQHFAKNTSKVVVHRPQLHALKRVTSN